MADECLLTGTAAHITPVIEVDHRKIADGNIGPITESLQSSYFDIIRGKNQKYIDWCTSAIPNKSR